MKKKILVLSITVIIKWRENLERHFGKLRKDKVFEKRRNKWKWKWRGTFWKMKMFLKKKIMKSKCFCLKKRKKNLKKKIWKRKKNWMKSSSHYSNFDFFWKNRKKILSSFTFLIQYFSSISRNFNKPFVAMFEANQNVRVAENAEK